MNDIVLSALLNLFALFGSRNGLDKEDSLSLVTDYLKRYFSIRSPRSYLNLYNELRDYYDDFPELDKETIVDGICSRLQDKIRKETQKAMLLRLLEFCSRREADFNPNDWIFLRIARIFGIGEELYSDFIDFVSERSSDQVLVMPLGEDGGTLKTLYMKDGNLLFFTYTGFGRVLMDDIPVLSGVFQIWQQSGVLKGSFFQPLYYSTIMAKYEKWKPANPITLCGRGVDFRFSEGGDNGMHNFSFTLHSGQLVAIMGGSGVGKSTLLSLLNGNLKPQNGTITVNGHPITELSAKALIGFVPQDDLLIEELTVYQNLWYTAKLCFDRMPDEELDRKVISVLTQLGLDAAKDLKVGSPLQKYISGGQRKRLNIALELIREPAILFLDEPTSGLSSTDTEKVISLLKEQTCKGKLIVVNIHQPSSDVYKLFDRLWLLDKGGYPVFDGNPIEAVSYFKSAANYTDSEETTCPTCGNVNPEIVLNIIDEKSLDAGGHQTEERKVSPKEWHELYLNKRGEMEEVPVTEVPPTDQKRPGVLKQVLIFLKRNVSTKVTNLQYMLVTLLEAPILAAICALLTHYVPDSGVYSVMDNKNLVSYFFMAVIVAVFLGMSGSAEEIIKDRALLKREKFLNLSYRSYIWSKILYMAAVCLVQTVLFILVGNHIMGLHGLFWTWWLVLFASAFLSSLIGLLLSQCMNSVVAIYITIPLLLIPQILLCGLVVKFDDLNPDSETGNVPIVGDFIPSRWAYEAIAVANFTSNLYERQLYEQDRDKYTCIWYQHAFLYELESQAESRRDKLARGEDASSFEAVLETEFPRLAFICDIPDYSGDWSYESVMDYIDSARDVLSKRGNATTLAMDRQINGIIRERGGDYLKQLKRDNYNIQLENFVLNRDTKKLCKVVGSHIVPKAGYVFLTPPSRNGRAPFYSGVKVVGHYEIETLWYNISVLLIMCVLLAVCLLNDFPGRLVRTERN